MKFMEGKSKTERYKLIAAIVLGIIAIASLSYLFFGDSFRSPSVAGSNKNNNSSKTSSTSKPKSTTPQTVDPTINDVIAEIIYTKNAPPPVGGSRNIFDIYVPPPPTPTPIPVIVPSPPPPPPLNLYSVSPANVFAKTGDFTIQITGDKFTPDTRVSFDNNDLPTKFVSPQQLTATVPAAFIANDGARQIMARTPDGKLYSNVGTLNVMAPPMPNYLYVGLIGDKRYKDDVALMRNKNDAKDLFSIRLNETINENSENRFKVLSISEREIVLIDKILKIKHTLPYTVGGSNSSSNDTRSFPQNNQRGFPQGAIPGIPPEYQRIQPQQQRNSDDDDDDEKPNPTLNVNPIPAPTKRP